MKISIINPQEGDEVETKKALKFKTREMQRGLFSEFIPHDKVKEEKNV